jgi:hypothetical protein
MTTGAHAAPMLSCNPYPAVFILLVPKKMHSFIKTIKNAFAISIYNIILRLDENVT